MQIKYVVLIMNQNDKFNQPMLLLLINAWLKQISNTNIRIFIPDNISETESLNDSVVVKYSPNCFKNGITFFPTMMTVELDTDVILLANIYNMPVNYIKYFRMVESTDIDYFINCDEIYYSVGTYSMWNQILKCGSLDGAKDLKILNIKYSDYFRKYTRSICLLGPTIRELHLYSDFDLRLPISGKSDFVNRMNYFLESNNKNKSELQITSNEIVTIVDNNRQNIEQINPINLDDIYEHVYIINLKSRTDRYQQMLTEMKNQSITNYQFYEAIRPNHDDICQWNENYCLHELRHRKNNFHNYQIGSFGCLQSHINVIQNAVNLNYKRVLILEDDTTFIRPIIELTQIIHEIGNNFDMLYMAINNVRRSKLHSINFNIVTKGLAACAYIITRPVMEYVLDNIKNTTLEIDAFYANVVQPKFRCFVINPQMTTQRPDYSDILGHYVNYKNFFKKP